jgi:hypothetical protein
MTFIMNETFMQIMDKFNEELQLQVESWVNDNS